MHKYQLQRYSGLQSKHRCPQCQHRRKTFSLYINTETNEPLASHAGKCDRLDKCGYHYTPKQYFESLVHSPWPMAHSQKSEQNPVVFKHHQMNHALSTMGYLLPQSNHGLSTIDHGLFKANLSRYEQNNFVQFLRLKFGDDITNRLIERYYIGTSRHWHGATVFWQVDVTGQIRTGKIMLYNATNAKRVKQPFNHITWVHTVLKNRYEMLDRRCETANSGAVNLKSQYSNLTSITQCLFGEHLLNDTSKPVAIVESEKTAIIASAYMPAYIWLATGGLSNLTPQKCQVLKNRKVHLYPDVNAFAIWQAKANELASIADFKLFPILEQIADVNCREDGLDIADYLMGVWPV